MRRHILKSVTSAAFLGWGQAAHASLHAGGTDAQWMLLLLVVAAPWLLGGMGVVALLICVLRRLSRARVRSTERR